MENLYEPNLTKNDNEHIPNKKLNIVNNIENNVKSPNVYNPVMFQTEILINIFEM